MAVRMDCFGATHVGRKRSSNQDQFLVADLNRSMQILQSSVGLGQQTRLYGNSQGKLLLVADGLGGQHAGERASTLAVDGIVEYILNTMPWLFRLDHQQEWDFEQDLKAALAYCQETLVREAEAIPQRSNMSTTLTMAYLIWPRMYIVHVGDSRCWLYRDGKLQQITRDHTLHQLFQEVEASHRVDSRTNKAAESLRGRTKAVYELGHRARHVLWNALSADKDLDDVTVDIDHRDLQLGDTILLGTDGLYNEVSEQGISAVLGKNVTAQQMCAQLVQKANSAGGSDNITVVVARFCEPFSNTAHTESAAETLADEKLDADLDAPKSLIACEGQKELRAES